MCSSYCWEVDYREGCTKGNWLSRWRQADASPSLCTCSFLRTCHHGNHCHDISMCLKHHSIGICSAFLQSLPPDFTQRVFTEVTVIPGKAPETVVDKGHQDLETCLQHLLQDLPGETQVSIWGIRTRPSTRERLLQILILHLKTYKNISFLLIRNPHISMWNKILYFIINSELKLQEDASCGSCSLRTQTHNL